MMFQNLTTAPAQDALLVMVHPWYPWMPPLGIVYVAHYLKHKGYQPLLFDFNTKLFNAVTPEKKKFWDIGTISEIPYPELAKILNEKFQDEIETLTEILNNRPEPIIGFSVNYLNIKVASKIAENIKKKSPHKLVVFGGPGCFWGYNRQDIIPGSVDIFVVGEGEVPFFEIVDNYYQGGDIFNVRGTIAYYKGREINNTPPNPVSNLDEIPFPTFEELDLDDYNFGKKQSRTLPLLISRGCISRCSFCVDYIMCHPFRTRSPREVIKEIEYHININGVKNFSLNDLLCNGHLEKLEELCDLIISRKLEIRWGSYAVARGDMSLRLLEKMKKAGCTTICYGIESGSDVVLKAMSKIYDSSDAERVLRLTHEAGIKATFNIIVGHPQEGRREFKETLVFIKRNRRYIHSIINVSTLFINPTSRLGTNPAQFEIYFPKHPWSYRLLNLKRIIFPKYYRIFGHSVPVSKLKGIDLSEFVDPKGNTKSQRLKRLIYILKFIHKLGLFKENPIINVYPTKNKKIKKIIEMIDKRQKIKKRCFLLECSYKGYARIFYKDIPVTGGSGFNVALRIRNNWYDSSQFNWEIDKISSQKLKVKITIPNIEIEQNWLFTFYKSYLVWEIKCICRNLELLPQEMKLGLQISNDYFYWMSLPYGGIFPELEREWKLLELRKADEISVIPNKDNVGLLPGIKLQVIKSIQYLNLCLENSPRDLGFRYVNFRGSYLQGFYKNVFKSAVKIGFWEMENEYVNKIKEKYVEMGIEEFYPQEKWKRNETIIEGILLGKKEGINIRLDRGVKVYSGSKEITASFGGNISFKFKRNIFDTSQAPWSVYKKNKGLQFRIYWTDIGLELLWNVFLSKNVMRWNFIITSINNIKLDDFKFSILLQNSYSRWTADKVAGEIPSSENKWQFIPLDKFRCNKLCLESKDGSFPTIICRKSEVGFFQIEIPRSTVLEGVFLHTLVPVLSLVKSKAVKFNYIFRIKL